MSDHEQDGYGIRTVRSRRCGIEPRQPGCSESGRRTMSEPLRSIRNRIERSGERRLSDGTAASHATCDGLQSMKSEVRPTDPPSFAPVESDEKETGSGWRDLTVDFSPYNLCGTSPSGRRTAHGNVHYRDCTCRYPIAEKGHTGNERKRVLSRCSRSATRVGIRDKE